MWSLVLVPVASTLSSSINLSVFCQVLGYPSKRIGLFINPSIIFRSDSNGEDLEGYAGAGLYDRCVLLQVTFDCLSFKMKKSIVFQVLLNISARLPLKKFFLLVTRNMKIYILRAELE